jgi:glycosyltransferase involved in cell wall biosynthesis
MNTPYISVVIPVFNCSECLVELNSRLKESLNTISENFEIIYINDSSTDDGWITISGLALKDKRIKGINLSRNFGQHYAITAGLDHCHGSWIVVMDSDLQDQPEDIVNLYNKTCEGFDIVLGRRSTNNFSSVNKFTGRVFYSLYNFLTRSSLDPNIGSFRILSSRVVLKYGLLNERIIFFGAMIDWLGFRVTAIDVDHKARKQGISSYNYIKKISLATDGIISFSDKPLKYILKLGLFLSSLALVFLMIICLRTMVGFQVFSEWQTVIAFIGLFTGIIITTLGIVGIYIGGIFREVKNRPRYIYSDTINIDLENQKD